MWFLFSSMPLGILSSKRVGMFIGRGSLLVRFYRTNKMPIDGLLNEREDMADVRCWRLHLDYRIFISLSSLSFRNTNSSCERSCSNTTHRLLLNKFVPGYFKFHFKNKKCQEILLTDSIGNKSVSIRSNKFVASPKRFKNSVGIA